MNNQIKDWLKKNQRLAGVISIAAVIIVIAVIAANRPKTLNTQSTAATQPTSTAQDDTDSSTDTSNQSTAPAAATTPTPAPAPATPTPPTTAQQVATWDAKYGSSISTIAADLTQAGKDGSNPPVLETDCTKIFDDSLKAQSVPAIPDATTNTNWQAALDSFVKGAQQCQYAANDGSTDEYNQATADFTAGTKSIDAANADIQKLES